MKKAFALLVIGLVLITAVCAATSTKYTKYGNIFKSGEFTLKGTSYSLGPGGTKTGTGSPLTVAMHAGQYYMDATMEGESMKVLIQNGEFNIISDKEKSIMTMKTMPTDETDGTINFPAAYEVFSSGRANLDGKTYNFEKAKEDDSSLTTYWYNGNDLFAIQSADTIIYVDSISQKADASLFTLPAGYQVQVMDLSSLFGDWGSSDSYSGYDYGSYDYGASDYDWSSTMSDIDWDGLFSGWYFDDEPHYYAFGILMGLNSTQAKSFEDYMTTFSEISWSSLNDYYDSATDKYDLKGQRLSGILAVDNDTMKKIQNLVDRFKK